MKGENLPKILETACDILKDWSLFVNVRVKPSSQGCTLYLAGMSEVDSNDNKIRGNEEWRDTVLLGSKLCSEKDITNRRNKANVAFYTYKNLWLDNNESRKLRLYEALVTSVLLYNCSCWAAPKKALDSVDVLQRKHPDRS